MNVLYFLIVNYNSSDLVSRLLDTLKNNSSDYRVVIINNSAEDKAIARLKNDRAVIIEAMENLGFGRACNLGLNWIYKQDSKAIVWLINPDAYFDVKQNRVVSSAIAFFQNHPQISILGTTVYNSEGNLTDAGGTFVPDTAALKTITSIPENNLESYSNTDWVSACSLLINLANFPQCPNFDPRYFLYYEDLDFCLRYGQQGHQIAVTDLLRVIHDTSSITNRNLYRKYKHITHSYLVHIEKHGSLQTFILTNIRMLLNTLRLIIIKPQQGAGKLVGFYSYWRARLTEKTA